MFISVIRLCYRKCLCVTLFSLLWLSKALPAADSMWVPLADLRKTIEETTRIGPHPLIIPLILSYVPSTFKWQCSARKSNPSDKRWSSMRYCYQGDNARIPRIQLLGFLGNSILDANTFALCDTENCESLQAAFQEDVISYCISWACGRNSSDKYTLWKSLASNSYSIYDRQSSQEIAVMSDYVLAPSLMRQLLEKDKIVYRELNRQGVPTGRLLAVDFLKEKAIEKAIIELPDNESVWNFVVSPDGTKIFIVSDQALYRWNKVRCCEVTES